MALPPGIPTVTVTGRYLTPDGKPLTGAVAWEPTADVVTFGESDVILSGPVRAVLDSTGSFSVTLPATDAAGMNPTGWNYEVLEQLAGVETQRVYAVLLPQENPAADIADLAPTDPMTPEYVAVRGDSAYEIAVANGFTGTEEEWLASLVGPQGEPGVVQSVNGISQANVVLAAADVGAVATTGAETVEGRKTFTDPMMIQSAVADALLTLEQTDPAAIAGVFKLIGGNAENVVFLGRGQEHAANAWAIRANGTFEVGDGAGGRDCILTRIGPTELSWTANVRCTAAAPTDVAHWTRKDYVDGLDTDNVKLNGDQTVAGVKTFTSSPLLPASAPTLNDQAAPKSYVDSTVAAIPDPARNTWTPQALGFQAWSFDPSAVAYPAATPASTEHVVGDTLFSGMNITESTDVNNVVIFARGWGGSAVAPSERFYAAIYDETGTRVADSGLISNLAPAGQIAGTSASASSGHVGAVPVPLLSTVTLAPGRYWGAFLHSAGSQNNFYYLSVENGSPQAPANFFLGATAFQRQWKLASQTSTPAVVDPAAAITDHPIPVMALALL